MVVEAVNDTLASEQYIRKPLYYLHWMYTVDPLYHKYKELNLTPSFYYP